MVIEYDGANYRGWQRQERSPTVQETIESAIEVACGEVTSVTGAGRTDTGVHARGQVAHADIKEPADAGLLLNSLNALTPRDIAIVALHEVRPDFHARYDARLRVYHYHVSTSARALDRNWRVRVPTRVDFGRMNRSAAELLGKHDFSSFCRSKSATKNRVCTVVNAEWRTESRDGDWCFSIEADRFLHGMVRAIVGTLLQVGIGGLVEDCIPEILAQHDRRAAGPAAKARGLVLHEVRYDDRDTLPWIS